MLQVRVTTRGWTCHSEGALALCHSEGAQRPKNLAPLELAETIILPLYLPRPSAKSSVGAYPNRARFFTEFTLERSEGFRMTKARPVRQSDTRCATQRGV